MQAVAIGRQAADDMQAACGEAQMRAASGQAHSAIIILHLQGEDVPHMVVLGRYKSDPFRALTALERGRIEVHRRMNGPAMNDFTFSKA